jgi:hypothetical protein
MTCVRVSFAIDDPLRSLRSFPPLSRRLGPTSGLDRFPEKMVITLARYPCTIGCKNVQVPIPHTDIECARHRSIPAVVVFLFQTTLALPAHAPTHTHGGGSTPGPMPLAARQRPLHARPPLPTSLFTKEDPGTGRGGCRGEQGPCLVGMRGGGKQKYADASLQDLVRQFLPLGFTAFGGPAAHIGLFEKIFCDRLKWLPRDVFMELFALGQCLPGPSSTQVRSALPSFSPRQRSTWWSAGDSQPLLPVMHHVGPMIPGATMSCQEALPPCLVTWATSWTRHGPTMPGSAPGQGMVEQGIACFDQGDHDMVTPCPGEKEKLQHRVPHNKHATMSQKKCNHVVRNKHATMSSRRKHSTECHATKMQPCAKQKT